MKQKQTRRDFVRTSGIAVLGIGITGTSQIPHQFIPLQNAGSDGSEITDISLPFVPVRAASWWCTLEDILWPQKKITERIKRRAEAFAKAGIDTAINFGFHIRFDFSNYFGQLHGYYADVCGELHKYDIKFLDHYSCNHVERPRGEDEFRKLHRGQRHHILLFHDPVAAGHAQYEGHLFNDLCETDIRDGSRGYARQYQLEIFCHNNPGFLDMHKKYLLRLLKEVPLDGMEVDDMCDYAGLTTCGCKYCRDRFLRDYGHEIPPFNDNNFWGDTTKSMLLWGNYDNPVFRDWIKMKADSVADHVRMVKDVIGDKPLMTCCSSTGPITLNSLALNLERMSPHLDLFMLENVGTSIRSADWVRMDAEALQQKDIAMKRGNAPALALSYTIYEQGGYLGWSLSRFWGVANWSSTLNQRLEEDPADAMETEDIIGPLNRWEMKNSDLNYREAKDPAEVRLVSSSLCRDNGWRDNDGSEQWDRVRSWSEQLVINNLGYRIVRSYELSDPDALCSENTPLILEGLGCVSESQLNAINTFLRNGGIVWLGLPFGTHDEKGYKRDVPLSVKLLKRKTNNLMLRKNFSIPEFLSYLLIKNRLHPALVQISGDPGWAARIRFYNEKPVIHFLNRRLVAVPHPGLKDIPGNPILKDIESDIKDNHLVFKVNAGKLKLKDLSAWSPESGDIPRPAGIVDSEQGYSTLDINLDGIKIYAVLQ